MNLKLLNFLKIFFLLVVAAGLLVFAFKGISVKKTLHDITQANIFWVMASVLLSIAAFISRTYRWNLLIEPLGYSPPLKKTFYSLMIGYFANLALPRLGEISRCGALSRAASIPFDKLLGTVIVERIIDVISLLICLLLAAIIEYKRLGNFFAENIFNPAIEKYKLLVKSPITIALVLIVVAGIITGLFVFMKRSRQKGKESRFVKLLKGLATGLRSISKLKRPWLFVFHSIFIWVLYYLGMYVCFFALAPTSGLGYNAALFLLVIGGLGMSAPVQGGIGVYHLLVSQGLMLYGLSQQDGITFATLIHSLQILIVVILGIASLLLLFFEGKKKLKPLNEGII